MQLPRRGKEEDRSEIFVGVTTFVLANLALQGAQFALSYAGYISLTLQQTVWISVLGSPAILLVTVIFGLRRLWVKEKKATEYWHGRAQSLWEEVATLERSVHDLQAARTWGYVPVFSASLSLKKDEGKRVPLKFYDNETLKILAKSDGAREFVLSIYDHDRVGYKPSTVLPPLPDVEYPIKVYRGLWVLEFTPAGGNGPLNVDVEVQRFTPIAQGGKPSKDRDLKS